MKVGDLYTGTKPACFAGEREELVRFGIVLRQRGPGGHKATMSIRAPAGCSTVAIIAMSSFGVVVTMTRFGVVVTMTRFGVLITMTRFGVLISVSARRMVITMTTTQAVPVIIRGSPTMQVVRRQLYTGRDIRAGHRDTSQPDLLQRERIHRLPFAAQGCNARMIEDTFGQRCDKARRGIHVKIGAVRQTGRMVGAGGETSERNCAKNQVDLHVTAAGLGSAKKGAVMVRQNDQKRKAEDG